MIQSGGGPRLSLKTFQRLMVAGEFLRQELKRNGATQLRILGLIDYPHAAAAQFLDDAVVRDGLTNHERATSKGRVMLGALGGQVNESDSPVPLTYTGAPISDLLHCGHSRISWIGDVIIGVLYSG